MNRYKGGYYQIAFDETDFEELDIELTTTKTISFETNQKFVKSLLDITHVKNGSRFIKNDKPILIYFRKGGNSCATFNAIASNVSLGLVSLIDENYIIFMVTVELNEFSIVISEI